MAYWLCGVFSALPSYDTSRDRGAALRIARGHVRSRGFGMWIVVQFEHGKVDAPTRQGYVHARPRSERNVFERRDATARARSMVHAQGEITSAMKTWASIR